jgi:hypothetical protein
MNDASDDLAHWIAASSGRGAERFELWQKMRGSEQQRVHVGAAAEPFDLADELLAHVEGDRRVELGHVSYAVFAYRAAGAAPVERAFVSPAPARAVPMPLAVGGVAGDGHIQPSAALASVFTSMQQMARDVFGSLQRENEHQRRTNEAMLRTSTGSFETFAKGYERTFGDLQGRLEAAIKEGVELRAKYQVLEHEKLELERTLEELNKVNKRELAEVERQQRIDQIAIETFKLGFPILLAKLSGKPIDAAIGGMTWGAFLDSITDDQVQKILAALREPQRIVVLEVLKAHRAAKKKAATGQDDAGAASGFADAMKARGGPATSPAGATPTPDEAALEQEFQRLAEVFVKHGDRFVAWMEQQTKQATPDATPAGPASS